MKTRPFFAARIEEKFDRLRNRALWRAGWRYSVIPYIGYGTDEQIRVVARVVLAPPKRPLISVATDLLHRRGWRNFLSAPAVRAKAKLFVTGDTINVVTDRGGYIDLRIKNPGLPPGWQSIKIQAGKQVVQAPIQVISSDLSFGIVSDIDDTIISTSLPRPLIAAWNSFVLTEQARQPVLGMARMYQQLLAQNPGAPLIYVSTGAWSTSPFLTRFMDHYGYPRGPMLLTDWGPTNTGWFRSGVDHKRSALRELARDFPNISWVLIGDDGQHDPDLYAELATLQPAHVRARVIRQLNFKESVLARGLLEPSQPEQVWVPEAAPEVRGPDGDELGAKLRAIL